MNKDDGINALTEDELQLLKLLAKGRRTSEIAKQLRLDFRRVADNCRNLKQKCNVTSNMELLALARHARIIE